MSTPKRSRSASEDDGREPKRSRTNSSVHPDLRINHAISGQIGDATTEDDDDTGLRISTAITPHGQARQSIQRTIAQVLSHDGFDGATPEAMESFTHMVETYLASLMSDAKWIAQSSRRSVPVPTDYERVLSRHNIPVASLKPHLRPPIPKAQRLPDYAEAITLDDDAWTTLPLLGPELSGQPDKESMLHIPATFPAFPSKHTYRFTPQDDANARDSQRVREDAARNAQQGEDALRRLVRASKMRKQKEVKSLVEKDSQGKERFRLWELTMKRFMGVENRGENIEQVDIADHSMIVNSDAVFSRKEVPKMGKRTTHTSNET